jgi:hypothetical protein
MSFQFYWVAYLVYLILFGTKDVIFVYNSNINCILENIIWNTAFCFHMLYLFGLPAFLDVFRYQLNASL